MCDETIIVTANGLSADSESFYEIITTHYKIDKGILTQSGVVRADYFRERVYM